MLFALYHPDVHSLDSSAIILREGFIPYNLTGASVRQLILKDLSSFKVKQPKGVFLP